MPDYKQLIDQVKEFAPVYQKILNPGATEIEVADFKKQVTVSIPNYFLEFYEVANGGQPYKTVDVEGMCFKSLEWILRSKNTFDKILAEKQSEKEFFTWHTDWLPFADDYSYDTLAIDTSGKVTGLPGCVLNRSKDSFEGEDILIIASSFKEFMEGWVKRVLDEKVYRKGSEESGSENWVEEHEELPRLQFVCPKF